MNEERESLTPKENFIKGKRLLSDGNVHAACKAFYKSFRAESDNPDYMSYYGMCAAESRGKIKAGLELCTRAIKKEFYRPEYYANLARVYMAAGNTKGAITAISKGIKYDTKDEKLHKMLIELGVRQAPIISFLKRSNPINKVLGIFLRRTLPQLISRKGPKKG